MHLRSGGDARFTSWWGKLRIARVEAAARRRVGIIFGGPNTLRRSADVAALIQSHGGPVERGKPPAEELPGEGPEAAVRYQTPGWQLAAEAFDKAGNILRQCSDGFAVRDRIPCVGGAADDHPSVDCGPREPRRHRCRDVRCRRQPVHNAPLHIPWCLIRRNTIEVRFASITGMDRTPVMARGHEDQHGIFHLSGALLTSAITAWLGRLGSRS